MDVMKTATSALGCVEPEAEDFSDQMAKIIRLLGAFPSFFSLLAPLAQKMVKKSV